MPSVGFVGFNAKIRPTLHFVTICYNLLQLDKQKVCQLNFKQDLCQVKNKKRGGGGKGGSL